MCILGASAASIALPATLRELGAEAAARRLLPSIALFPGAVWMAVSADGLFAGVAVAGLALVCMGAARGRILASLAGGLLLGIAVFLSYGLVLFGLVVLLVMLLTVRHRGLRSVVAPWLVATVEFAAVAAVHLALGFNWVSGLLALRPLLPGHRQPASVLLFRLCGSRRLVGQLLAALGDQHHALDCSAQPGDAVEPGPRTGP